MTKHTTDLSARPGVSRYAAHAGDTETWIDAAAPTVAEAEKLHSVYSAAPDLLDALRQLLFASENADETGYVTDAGFLDLEAIQQAAHAAITKAEGSAE